jgi:hypothetical protein
LANLIRASSPVPSPNNSSSWSTTNRRAALTSRSKPSFCRNACSIAPSMRRIGLIAVSSPCASNAAKSAGVSKSLAPSSGSASGRPSSSSARSSVRTKSARARAANGSADSSPGRITATRQTSMLGITPAIVNRGNRPARTRDDFPDPLGPSTSKNGQPLSAASLRRSVALAMSRLRPKNTKACLGPNAASPRNGEPLSDTGQTAGRPCSTFSPSHLRNSVRSSPFLGSLNGAQHLICRSARIGAIVCHAGKIARQLGTEPSAKDRNHQVAICRLRYLRLKGFVRFVEFILPADRGQARDTMEFAVEPFHHAFQPSALEAGIHG